MHDKLMKEDLATIDVDKDKPDPKWHKPLFLFGTIVMVFLMLSFIFVSSPITRIIEGQLESNTLENAQLQLGALSLTFTGNTLSELQQMYFAEQQVEFSVCLQGVKEGNEYTIASLYQPTMFQQTFNHVQFEPCIDSIVLLHTHPYKSCVASDTDLNTLEKMKKGNEDVLMVVMCEPDRFSVYG
jgi:proteasome lid subunit RPN8/RPN11